MRFFIWTASVTIAVLAILAFVFIQVVTAQDASVQDFSSSAPTKQSSTPSLSDAEKLDQQIATNINLYGQLVCDKLAEDPDASIDGLVERFIENYGFAGTSVDQQIPIAERLLTGASEQFCPEQLPRIAAAFSD